jgi:formylglycine-generating enzyme required for sulfatase activity
VNANISFAIYPKINMKKQLLTFIFAICISLTSFANGISVTSVSASGSNVTFTLAWNNSWHAGATTPANWDAAWVFIKYQNCTDNAWNHGTINASGNSITGSTLQIDQVADAKGVFVRRIAQGSGNVSASVTLSLASLPPGTVNFKVFAIEMVNVPQGSYALGDATAINAPFTEQAITAETALAANLLISGSALLPAAFPKGFNAFYCMKYEVSAQQYVDFLNSLTYNQQLNRAGGSAATIFPSQPAGTLNAVGQHSRIEIKTPGIDYGANATSQPAVYACERDNDGVYDEANADGLYMGCGYLSYEDVMSYLDWAALRPMTEMEFEKACRGGINRLAGEYAWGSVAIRPAGASGVINAGADNEASNDMIANGNIGDGYIARPVRGGFAAGASSTRQTSGATHYGIMEMSGSVWEYCVAAVGTNPITFTGGLGDGSLDVNGKYNVANWLSSLTSRTARGGGYPYYSGYVNYYFFVGNRSQINFDTNLTTRTAEFGGRGVR